MNYILLFINILMLVSGQVLWKQASGKIHPELSFKGIVGTLFNPYILCGGIIYVLATVIWIYLLSKENLSKIYPLQSLSYVLGALAGVIFFGEQLNAEKILGLVLILSGAYIIAVK